ncbi:MAG: FHA domain-containing protein [Myxococcota bacterium]|nr:FHA domain-containing protein [Myxococcota bacterium]
MRSDASSLDEARFCTIHRHPVLVSLEVDAGLLKPITGAQGPGTMRHLQTAQASFAPSVVQYVTLDHHVSPPTSRWISIGRTSENDVAVNDYAVSRHHARFRFVEGAGYVIEDLESVNGTAVDGDWIDTSEPVGIRSGQRLRFGRLSFTFMRPEDFYSFLVALVPMNPSE